MPYYADVRRYQWQSDIANAESLVKTPRITETKHRTNTKYYVYYLIDIYYSNISTFSNWKTAVNNNVTGIDGKGILVSENASTNVSNGLAAGLTTSVTVNKNTTSSNITHGEVVNDNSHNKVSFNRKSGATNTDVFASPTVAIQWKSSASPNWTSISNIYWRTTNNVQPGILWTTVVTDPIFPLEAIQDVIKPPTYAGVVLLVDKTAPVYISNRAWDKCTDLWNFVVHFAAQNYDQHWTCTKNGDQCKPSSSPSANDLSTKTKLEAWTKQHVTKPMIAAKSNKLCQEISSGNGLKDIESITPPKGDTRWNPPTHRDARDISHGERVKYENNDSFNSVSAFSKTERGRIFQDSNSAAVLNKSAQKLKDQVSANSAAYQWGFRFMYNPTTFGYQTSSNNSVDWTLGQADPATLLSGNSAVSFEVYINRIPDLKYLRLKNPKVPEDQVYGGRVLSKEEREGILNRGTEYDIEFLYRVLNGDPLSKSLLLSYNGVTSDFGYTTGVPCWLVLNENLRYYGSVASFSVNHAMFDLNMVPMLSTVSITFARYPALWNNTDVVGTGASLSSIKEYLKSTPNG